MNFFDELEKFAENPCLIDGHAGTFSYRQINNFCSDVSLSLSSEKKLVVIVCENRYEAVVGYLSVLQSNGAALLVNKSLSADLLQQIINRYQPHYIWKAVEGEKDSPCQQVGDYGLFALANNIGTQIHPSLSLLLATSGSTGSPKFVRLQEKNVSSNAASIAEYLALDSSERPITTLPMAYSYGLSIINSHLLVGAAILLTESSLMEKSFWRFLREQQATSMSGVPYTYEMLERLRFSKMELPSIRTMTQAGGKLSPKLAKYFVGAATEKSIQLYIMYGQTEATARISYVPADTVQEKYQSIGKPIPGGELFIDAENQELTQEAGIEGELIYQGSNVMMGYAESAADLMKGDELAGRLITGDIGRVDEDGFFYVTGRVKRIIKMFGNRVNLDHLDHFIAENGYNGVSGGQDDNLRVAIVGEEDIAVIKKKIVKTFKFNHHAVDVFIASEIPRSESGKILYGQLFEADR